MDEALSLIDYATKQTEEELLFQRWIHDVQFTMSFEEFKQTLQPRREKDTGDILDTVQAIIKQDGKGWSQ